MAQVMGSVFIACTVFAVFKIIELWLYLERSDEE